MDKRMTSMLAEIKKKIRNQALEHEEFDPF